MSKPFVVFEGIDNTGKSTQATAVTNELYRQGSSVFCTFEPTKETFYGKTVRSIPNLTTLERTALMLADRREHTQTLKQRLNQGYLVICDRYFWSSIVYNSQCEVSRQLILDSISQDCLVPDLIVYFEGAAYPSKPEDSLAQVMELPSVQHQAKLNYTKLLASNTAIPVLVVSTASTQEEITRQIVAEIKSLENYD